jgi:hypothetical protein
MDTNRNEGKVMKVTDSVWRILDINHQENMVVLVSGTSPTVKRYGTPSAIDKVEIELGHLIVYCEDGVNWSINIADGSRRKL